MERILDKKVLTIRGFRLKKDKRKKHEYIEPVYILKEDSDNG